MALMTIGWRKGSVRIIDQTKLPQRFVLKDCRDIRSLWQAIKKLQVRGAPALGVAAALGILLVSEKATGTLPQVKKKLRSAARYLATARPTAVNLFWGLRRMTAVLDQCQGCSVKTLRQALFDEAMAIIDHDRSVCRRLGMYGAQLVKSGDRILTHCNAGALATVDYGTALGVFFTSRRQGKKIRVYADETRPLLQGSRLTAWELLHERIPVTLQCDNMAASLMKAGKIDKIFVGADRIAANGDTANKIGTYSLAVLAHYHRIPFYVVAPVSTFDFSLSDGNAIPIEERDPDEVRTFGGVYVAPRTVPVYNPAFDVTPHALITAIVTEYGIFRKPSRQSLRRLFYKKNTGI